MPNLSVALATYNGQQYISAQLDSIAKQTAAPSELIVADDDSSDGTLTIVRKFAENASFPVRIIQNKSRLGYRVNFMQAASACSAELIAFCDQDDIWHPEKLKIMGKAFADPAVLLAYHNTSLIDDAGRARGQTSRWRQTKTFAPLTLYPWLIIPGLAQVVRRSLVRLTSLHAGSVDPYAPDQPMPHDQWYPFWASVLGGIAYVPDSLAQYRQHGANVSGWPAHYIAYAIDHIRNAEIYIGGNAIGARNRLQLLQRARDLVTADERARIDAAVPYYQALCIQSDQRLAIYHNKTIASRLRALVSLIGQGAYTGSGSNALGSDAILLDAFIGMLFTRLGRTR
jgi:glycosyltransferase involved in cell wall biosynthesis